MYHIISLAVLDLCMKKMANIAMNTEGSSNSVNIKIFVIHLPPGESMRQEACVLGLELAKTH